MSASGKRQRGKRESDSSTNGGEPGSSPPRAPVRPAEWTHTAPAQDAPCSAGRALLLTSARPWDTGSAAG